MELESHLCFPSCGKLCVESGREWFCISSTGGACHTVLEARMVGTETSGGPKVHFSMKVNKNPCLCLQRQSGPSVTGPSVLTACHHLSSSTSASSALMIRLCCSGTMDSWHQARVTRALERLGFPFCHGRLALWYLSRVEPHKLPRA